MTEYHQTMQAQEVGDEEVPDPYRPGLVTVEVTNVSGENIDRGPYLFPPDSFKVVTIAAAELKMLTAHRDLQVKMLDNVTEDTKIHRGFSFVEDQNQSVNNRSPGALDDWLDPLTVESSGTPALKNGRMSEIVLETGARERAAELRVDLLSVSGTGFDGVVMIADVEDAYEATHNSPVAGVMGGADRPPHEIGVLAKSKELDATAPAQRLAEENDVDLALVIPTGISGHTNIGDRYITSEDVQSYMESRDAQLLVEETHREAVQAQKIGQPLKGRHGDTTLPPHRSGQAPEPPAPEVTDERRRYMDDPNKRDLHKHIPPTPSPAGHQNFPENEGEIAPEGVETHDPYEYDTEHEEHAAGVDEASPEAILDPVERSLDDPNVAVESDDDENDAPVESDEGSTEGAEEESPHTFGEPVEGADKDPHTSDEPEATEAARERAEDNNVDLAEVEATGAGGKIVVADVNRYIDQRG